MCKNKIKAYVITKGKTDINNAEQYGVVICNDGYPVYKCDELTNRLDIAQKFVEMINNSFIM